jgi:hypothetical protein
MPDGQHQRQLREELDCQDPQHQHQLRDELSRLPGAGVIINISWKKNYRLAGSQHYALTKPIIQDK